MFNEGNQIHNFMSSSGSGTIINYGSGSGSDFLASYGSGSGSTSQKITVPTVPVPVPQHWESSVIIGCLCVQVPKADYELPLGKADILLPGTDITLIGWGTQVSSSLSLKGRIMRMLVSLHLIDHKFN
jgi:hypothetical protein